MRVSFIALLSVFLNLNSAQASDDAHCKPVDLNEDTVLREMSVNDQGKTSTCYAQAATQLIEFKERSVGRKTSLSPFDLALSYKNSLSLVSEPQAYIFSKSYEVGMMTNGQKGLFEAAYKHGIASSVCVEAEIEKFAQEEGIKPAEFIKLLQEVRRTESVFKTVGEEKDLLKKNSYACNHQPALDALEKAGLWAQGTTDILLQVLATCTERRKAIPPWPFREDYVSGMGSGDRLFPIVDQALSKKLPAQLGLCAGILDEKKDYTPYVMNNRVNGSGVTDKCGGHSVLTVGRKLIDGKCHYMIRNSWGKDWQSPVGLICGCRLPNGTYYKDCKVLEDQIAQGKLPQSLGDKKEVLGCWVSKENLSGNLRQVSALD